MAELTKRAANPRVGATAAGGGAGYAAAQMIVELANKAGADLSPEFQTSLAIVLVLVVGWAAGWMTRDRDE